MKHKQLITCYRGIVKSGKPCRGLKVAKDEFRTAILITTQKYGNIPHIEAIEAAFIAVLDTDSNWGRNELVQQLSLVINQIKTEVFLCW